MVSGNRRTFRYGSYGTATGKSEMALIPRVLSIPTTPTSSLLQTCLYVLYTLSIWRGGSLATRRPRQEKFDFLLAVVLYLIRSSWEDVWHLMSKDESGTRPLSNYTVHFALYGKELTIAFSE